MCRHLFWLLIYRGSIQTCTNQIQTRH